MNDIDRPLYRHAQLSRLFSPQSIAVVGASPSETSFGTRTIERLERDFTGPVHAVNAKYERIGQRVCYPDIAALPQRPDCVVIALPSDAVEDAVRQCVGQDVGGILIFASGYAETGQPERIAMQRRLTRIAREHDLRIVGPNSLGFFNFTIRAGLSFTRSDIRIDAFRDRGIGIVSQSGSMAFAQSQGAFRGVSLSHVIALGNSCDIDIADSVAYLAGDPACRAIVCIFEGLARPQRLIEAGEIAWAADKPLIVCKQGVGETGARVALSHSGAMTGTLQAWEAAFRRAGIIMLNDLDRLMETASFFVKVPRRPAGRGVAAVATSGGALVSMADKADLHGVAMPQPHEAVRRILAARVPEFGAARNPCDATAMASRDPDMIPACIEALASDDHYCTVMYPQTSVIPKVVEELRRFSQACARHNKPLSVVWLTAWLGGYGAVEAESDPNTAVFWSLSHYFWTLREWFRRDDRYLDLEQHGQRQVQRLTSPAVQAQAAALLRSARGPVLTEREAKTVLALYGVPVVGERLVHSAEAAVQAAVQLGLPVVLKLESPDLPHKTEADVIRLGLDSAEAVRAAWTQIMANAARVQPPPRINGVLVQPMVSRGTEIMAGGRIDPLFGPLIITGPGGVMVELLDDRAVEMAPITQREASAMLARLRKTSLLDGFRGAPAVHRERLAEVLVRLAELLDDQRELITELDVNPLICAGERILAVDALIVLRREDTPPG